MIVKARLSLVKLAPLLVAAACLYLSSCTTIPSPGLLPVYIHKGKPFLIVQTEGSMGWGYISHADLTMHSTNALLLGYGRSGDTAGRFQVPKELKDLGPAFSRDGGKTWLIGMRAITNVAPDVPYAFGYSVNHDGLTLSYQGTENKQGKFRMAWYDGVELLKGPEMVPCEFPYTNVMFYLTPHGGVSYPDGRVMATACTRFPGDRRTRVVAIESTDNGESWQYLSTIATDADAPWGKEWPAGFEGPSETSMVVLPNGDLLCVVRVGVKKKNSYEPATGAMHMLQARSRDGGRTWSSKCLAIEGVCPKLLLMKNGILVLAFGRPGNNLIFSANGGITWAREIALTPADTRTSGYVDMAEVAPGKLFVAYDAYDTSVGKIWLWEPQEVNGIFGVFVDVNRFIGGPK